MVEAINGTKSHAEKIGSDIEPSIEAFHEFLSDAAESSMPAQNFIRAKLEHFQADIVRALSDNELNTIKRLQEARAKHKQAVKMLAG